MLGMPVVAFVSKSDALLGVDPLVQLYAAASDLIGELPARALFCGIWLAFGLALFWRIEIRKETDDAPPADLHD